MCGRYELHTHPAALALAFGVPAPPELLARYNIAPTQQVPIVRENAAGERELVEMRWGLVPRWAKDPSIGAKMINARAETVAVKPAFETPYRRHRCLLPATGFYEWRAVKGGKQPVYIGMKSGEPLGLAGLYERWLGPDGRILDTCTILTTPANELLRAVHIRMPLIIAPIDYARWLDRANDDVADLLVPYPAQPMTWYSISPRVNAVRNDDPSLLDRVPEAEAPAIADEDAERVPEQTRLL